MQCVPASPPGRVRGWVQCFIVTAPAAPVPSYEPRTAIINDVINVQCDTKALACQALHSAKGGGVGRLHCVQHAAAEGVGCPRNLQTTGVDTPEHNAQAAEHERGGGRMEERMRGREQDGGGGSRRREERGSRRGQDGGGESRMGGGTDGRMQDLNLVFCFCQHGGIVLSNICVLLCWIHLLHSDNVFDIITCCVKSPHVNVNRASQQKGGRRGAQHGEAWCYAESVASLSKYPPSACHAGCRDAAQ